jgi:hypothetical protein
MIFQGELEHRRVKRFYARSNRISFRWQISKLERRTARLREMRKRLLAEGRSVFQAVDEERLPRSNPGDHYHMSNSRKIHFDMTKWLWDNKDDQAVEVCSSAFNM